MATTQDGTISELQRAVTVLRQERDGARAERDAALAQRNTEFGERIEHQAATIDVLKAMSASSGDPQPVFDLITTRARELCGSVASMLFEYDGELLHMRTWGGYDPAAAESYLRQFPMRPDRSTAVGRAILEQRIVHIRDVAADPEISVTVRTMGVGSTIVIPLQRDGQSLGVIAIGLLTPGGFSDSQVELLKTFAEQGVIAISSAETYRALQARTADLQESLEYQTATSDVLKVISRSTFDLQPVLDTLVETAARLCGADQAVISRRDGDLLRLAANFGFPPEYETYFKARGQEKLDPDSPTIAHRTAIECRPVHINDVAAVPCYPEALIRLGKHRTSLGVPLLREGESIGVILLARQRVEPFTDRQIELVSTFADQAVIAMENARLLTEQREALEQQTATAEVLQVINASPGNLTPVFDAMLEKATRLCEAASGILWTYDGTDFSVAALHGVSADAADHLRKLTGPRRSKSLTAIARGDVVVRDDDFTLNQRPSWAFDTAGMRTGFIVAMHKRDELVGAIRIFRREARPFSDKEIALVQNFAAQAVIAMENARLLTEQREALEQQTATAEVLQVINGSQGNLTPVFEAMLEKAMRLCEASGGALRLYDNGVFRLAAMRGMPEAFADATRDSRPSPQNALGRIACGERLIHVADLADPDDPLAQTSFRRMMIERGGIRTALWVALHSQSSLQGTFVLFRQQVRPFSDKQIALVQNFAAQAVIAIENARLLDEIRQRQEELRITFENMGDGVAMFDETPRLVAWNRKFQDILDLPDGVLAERLTFPDYIRYLTERGEYGVEANPEEQIRHLTGQAGEVRAYERTRPDGRVIEIRRNPVAGGGFVLIFSDITARKRNEAEIRAARDAAEEASRAIEAAFRELKAAQANLIQAEKMASLGQLTAGIAHEIKNPLNFVNNFAALSVDLLSELKETAAPGFAALAADQRAEIDDVSAMLTSNLEKITEHGKRADGIVKAMLEHSRGSSAERRMVDLNALIDEALNLAYHGARAQDQSFNITLERNFYEGIAPIEVNPQDMTRVFLNIFSNGFYAANKRARSGAEAGFVPTLKVTTRDAGEALEIRVRDNGTGIPVEIRDKLFQPFFTTKPTGEGTGLGLSITYDIVTKQHGGSIMVESEPGAFTEFAIRLPRQ